MGLNLPRFEHVLDLEELHEELAGIEVVLILNPAFPEWTDPFRDIEVLDEDGNVDETASQVARMKARAEEPWRTSEWHFRAHKIRHVYVPPQFTDDERGEKIEIAGDARALWDLESREDFDPMLTHWALAQWGNKREEWLEAASKNLPEP